MPPFTEHAALLRRIELGYENAIKLHRLLRGYGSKVRVPVRHAAAPLNCKNIECHVNISLLRYCALPNGSNLIPTSLWRAERRPEVLGVLGREQGGCAERVAPFPRCSIRLQPTLECVARQHSHLLLVPPSLTSAAGI